MWEPASSRKSRRSSMRCSGWSPPSTPAANWSRRWAIWSNARRLSRYAAAPAKCCAGSSRAGWACDEHARDRGAPQVPWGAPSVGGVGGPCRGPPCSRMTNELRSLLSDTVTRLFTDLVTKELIESAERGVWPDKLWRALEEGGLTLPLVPEARGGAGGSWRDAHVVVRAAGEHAAPIPLAETIVASGLLARAGLE